jgi:hypothetical protein
MDTYRLTGHPVPTVNMCRDLRGLGRRSRDVTALRDPVRCGKIYLTATRATMTMIMARVSHFPARPATVPSRCATEGRRCERPEPC